MKILAAEKYHFITGGASRVFFDTTELLGERGHRVFPFTGRYPANFPSEYSKYFVPRFTVFSGEREEPASLSRQIKAFIDAHYAFDTARAVRRMVGDLSPDVAHLHTILYQLSPSLITSLKSRGVPVVQTLHDFSLFCGQNNLYVDGAICERCSGKRFHNLFLHNCYKKNRLMTLMAFSAKVFHEGLKIYPGGVDLFIAPSRFVREKLIDFGLPSHRIVHLNHFVDAKKLPGPEYADEGTYLYAGYLSREKGIFTLVEAMSRGRLPGRLQIAGRGPMKDSLVRTIEKSRIRNVDLVGFLSRDRLLELIRKSRFLIFPSVAYETFGMGVIEANLMGKPVIASDLGAYPEVIIPGKTGLLFEPGNSGDLASKIDFLWNHPELCRDMGRAAREHALRHFNADLHYEKLISLYRRVIGRKRRTA